MVTDPGRPEPIAANARAQGIARDCRTAGVDRARLIGFLTGGRTEHGTDLTDVEFVLVRTMVDRIRRGEVRFVVSPIDGTCRLEEPAPVPAAGVDSDDPAWWPAARWRAFVRTRGMNSGQVLRRAISLCQKHGLPTPADLGSWSDARVSEALYEWLVSVPVVESNSSGSAGGDPVEPSDVPAPGSSPLSAEGEAA